MTRVAKPSIKSDPSNDFLTPDSNFLTLLRKVVSDNAAQSPDRKENEYVGSIEYRVVGTTTMETTLNAIQSADKNATSKTGAIKNAIVTGLDIDYIAADPFYDRDIDEERVRSKGRVDYTQILDKILLFLYSEGLYHVLFPRKRIIKKASNTQLEEYFLQNEIIASFLLRVDLDKSSYGALTTLKGEKFLFTFNDRANLREPELEKHISRPENSGGKEERN